MAVYNILPSTNLKTEDIRDTLNANGGSVSNDCLTFFTDAANIRMWVTMFSFILSLCLNFFLYLYHS